MSKEAAMAIATSQPSPIETTHAGSPGLVGLETPKELDSSRFASFAKKEAEFVRRQQEFKKEREDWTHSDKAKADAILKRAEEFEAAKSADPIAALKQIGFSETDIFNFLAAQEKKELTPEEKAAKAATEATEARLKEFQDLQTQQAQEIQQKEDQALLTQYKSGLSTEIETHKDKYEYCAYYGAVAEELAYETVLAIVKESKGQDVPTAQEAIEMVEKYYEEQDQLMSSIKKRQPKVEEAQATEAPKTPERSRTITTPNGSTAPKPPITKTRTITNSATATVASTVKRVNETPSQKRERLIEALRNGAKL